MKKMIIRLIIYYLILTKSEINGKWYKFRFKLGDDTYAVSRVNCRYSGISEFSDNAYYWYKIFDNVFKLVSVQPLD